MNAESSEISIENATFVYACHEDVLLVSVVHHNHHPNIGLIFEFLFEKLGIIHKHLGDHFKAEDVRTAEGMKIVEAVLCDKLNE